MRQLYQHKQQYCLRLIAQHLPDARLHARYAGLHLTLEFVYAIADKDLCSALLDQGYRVQPLSRYVFTAPERTGLVIGLANTSEAQLKSGIEYIALLLLFYRQSS